ncbi:hypothetical protein KAW65_07695 [candidate division WOR-3 bacterium]|nr:hypothetical protein [candidate division WOR-3 bacterium]
MFEKTLYFVKRGSLKMLLSGLILFFAASFVSAKERVPESVGREKYVAEVIAEFTPGSWSPSKGMPGPYELGIYECEVLAGPGSIAIDDSGNIYILDTVNWRIQKYNGKGKFLSSIIIGKKSRTGYDLCLDKEGNIYVLDMGFHEVRKYNQESELLFRSAYSYSKSSSEEDRVKGMIFLPKTIYVDQIENLYLDSWKVTLTKTEPFLLEPQEHLSVTPNPIGIESYIISKKGSDTLFIKKAHPERGERVITILKWKEGSPGLLGEDLEENIYLVVGKCEWEGAGGYLREIRKINKNGELVASIDNFPPYPSGWRAVRNIVMDNQGNIYWLIYWSHRGKGGGKLIKWYKAE